MVSPTRHPTCALISTKQLQGDVPVMTWAMEARSSILLFSLLRFFRNIEMCPLDPSFLLWSLNALSVCVCVVVCHCCCCCLYTYQTQGHKNELALTWKSLENTFQPTILISRCRPSKCTLTTYVTVTQQQTASISSKQR